VTDKTPVDLDRLDAKLEHCRKYMEDDGTFLHAYPAMAEELRRLRARVAELEGK
jgi:hypothetical protein